VESVIEQFKISPIGKIFLNDENRKRVTELLDSYLIDFIYMVHPCVNSHEHKVYITILISQNYITVKGTEFVYLGLNMLHLLSTVYFQFCFKHLISS